MLRLHTWPDGPEKEIEWLTEAAKHIEDIIAQHGLPAPDLDPPAPSALSPRNVQAAAEGAGQVSATSDRIAQAFHAQMGQAAAKQLPHWLSALSVSQPQQPSQHGSLIDSLQISQSMQHGPSQATPHSSTPVEAHMASQHIQHASIPSGNPSHDKIRALACKNSSTHKTTLCLHE